MKATAHSLTEAYVQATNQADAAKFISLFAENAIVNDNGREFRGQNAIAEWSEKEIFAVHVQLQPIDSVEDESGVTITTKVDGDFDKTGLPDPLHIAHSLKIENEKIVELSCKLAT